MREEWLAVEQLPEGLSCVQRWEWVVRGRIYGVWARVATLGVRLNNLSQTRDIKALVNGAYCIVNECITCATDRNLDVGSRQGLGLRRVFNQGGRGSAPERAARPLIHSGMGKIFTLPSLHPQHRRGRAVCASCEPPQIEAHRPFT